MGVFFIDTESGQVATQRQLMEAGIATPDGEAPLPWFRIRGGVDATTMWYAVMRKKTKGVYIGALCIRHSDHHASLRQAGWEEVSPTDIEAPGLQEM